MLSYITLLKLVFDPLKPMHEIFPCTVSSAFSHSLHFAEILVRKSGNYLDWFKINEFTLKHCIFWADNPVFNALTSELNVCGVKSAA